MKTLQKYSISDILKIANTLVFAVAGRIVIQQHGHLH